MPFPRFIHSVQCALLPSLSQQQVIVIPKPPAPSGYPPTAKAIWTDLHPSTLETNSKKTPDIQILGTSKLLKLIFAPNMLL